MTSQQLTEKAGSVTRVADLQTASQKTLKVGVTHTVSVCNSPTSYTSIKVKITGEVFPARLKGIQ